MITSPAYHEIIDFFAAGTTPDSIISFQPSVVAKQRVEELIRNEKNAGLSMDERTELDYYMHLEHIMRLAKARARRHIQAQ